MATGLACRLFRANFRRLVMLETDMPMAVRRCVSFCEAVYDGAITVEGITARRAAAVLDISRIWGAGEIPVFQDPEWDVIPDLGPQVVIDAIIAKKNLGTDMAEAPWSSGWDRDFLPERMSTVSSRPTGVMIWAGLLKRGRPRQIPEFRASSAGCRWNGCCVPPVPVCSLHPVPSEIW